MGRKIRWSPEGGALFEITDPPVPALVQEIEEEARIRREAAGIKPLWVKAILAQETPPTVPGS